MESFLNRLIENIIIINNHGEVIFINRAFVNSLGYEYGKITLESVNQAIEIEGARINYIYDDIVKEGVYESETIQWQGHMASSVIIKWKNQINYNDKVDMYEKLLDKSETCAVVKELKDKLLYVNKLCVDFHDIGEEKQIEFLNESVNVAKCDCDKVQNGYHVIDNSFINFLCVEIEFIIKRIEACKMSDNELKYINEIKSELEAFLSASTDILLKINGIDIKSVSESCFEVVGWTKEQILTMDIEEFIHPDDRESTLRQLMGQVESDENLVFENRIRCGNGNYKWLRWSNINYMKTRGYVYASGKDITVEKELELREREIEKARELEEVKNEFFGNISHEFKTPINLIMVSNQLMEKRLTDYGLEKGIKKEIERYINIYKQNGYRLLRLVNNLIDITKIDSGFYNIKPVNANIINIIEDIVLSVVEYSRGNEIELVFDTEVEEEIIACDPDQIERIILNLLSNAVKYTPRNGEIRVLISLEQEYVVTKVIDTGTGIPKERLGIVFERFGRCEDTLTKACEGSGIGLSLVKALVEMHEGSITVLSEVGVGSTFEVKLPRKQMDIITISCENQEIKQSKIEKCSIEFSDIYNL